MPPPILRKDIRECFRENSDYIELFTEEKATKERHLREGMKLDEEGQSGLRTSKLTDPFGPAQLSFPILRMKSTISGGISATTQEKTQPLGMSGLSLLLSPFLLLLVVVALTHRKGNDS
jgi:hypothetical protein